ncbi:two-component system sensor histidine kinase YesM [Bacillus oleivorans]|uniref:histidine kinase n=1 Tax=Bacillus oleivorans TaxID=1448271 RepID=A0A285D6N5_9BACI|nr:sensor histidine kinase [Bacillus oleivorans]SNX75480.1 two-component system sensor histidine kinase YesM [Bacillus oleivorans]
MEIQIIKQSFQNYLLSLPYRVKLMLVFSLLILLTASILGSITYYQFAKSSQKRTEEYQIQLANQINQNINRYLREMQIISLSPLYDQQILDILINHQTPSESTSFPPASERLPMWRFISSLIHMRNEIKGIHILANDGTIFSNLDSNTVMLRVFERNNKWIKEIERADGEWVLLPLHQPNYYLKKETAVFSVARLIRDPSTYDPLGIIKIDLKQELIEEIVGNTNSSSQIFIVDQNNQFIYPNKEEKIIESSFISELEGIQVKNYTNIPINGRDYMMVYNESDYSGMKTVMLTPRSIVFSEVNRLRRMMVAVVVVGIVISFLLGFILSKPLVQSIHKLRKAMDKVQRGYLSQRVEITSNDEIGQLGKGFNHMISEIDRLVSEVYKTSLREKDAEIRALQSQMNPHFLYNTLESINMLAITKGNLEVSDMVTSLGKLLRYTIDNSAKIVMLKEELSFIQSYIAIQRVRMGDKLQYREEIDPQVNDVLLPKLVLQPLVENAIVHGLSIQGGLISIKGKSENGLLTIKVEDNGKGITPERLAELKRFIESQQHTASDKHSGIALSNVHERIRLLYGNQFGIEIEGGEESGFSVKLTLPLERRGEGNKRDSSR